MMTTRWGSVYEDGFVHGHAPVPTYLYKGVFTLSFPFTTKGRRWVTARKQGVNSSKRDRPVHCVPKIPYDLLWCGSNIAIRGLQVAKQQLADITSAHLVVSSTSEALLLLPKFLIVTDLQLHGSYLLWPIVSWP